MLKIHQDKIFNYSTSTPSPEALGNLSPTLSLAEGTPIIDPPPSAWILRLAHSPPNPPSPVTLTPDLLVPDQSAPAPLPTPSTVPDSVKFGPGIKEALPYVAIAQTTYPPPAETPRDYLVASAKATARELHCAPSLIDFLASKKRKTLGTLLEAVRNPVSDLLHSYVEEGIPVHNGPLWSSRAMVTAISKGTHASAYTP